MLATETTPKTKGQTKIELKDEERTQCEVWTRVMGYHRPTSSFNPGKVSEFKDRKWYKLSPNSLA
jgi:anaerobic ribonucleoside-triphosphate reductase